MRTRARKTSTTASEPSKPTHIETKRKKSINKKNWIMAISLVSIFLMVLLMNTYFNFTSGVAINPNGESLSDTYYLSGPDPYYNLRLVKETLETGEYPFYGKTNPDPLLNYPLGRSGSRPPLLNMMAISFSRLLAPFMDEGDAAGYSMQFVPALFGALLIFPVYLIGKTLFGRKEGLIAALLIAIIPIHIGSGHGSAYGLFDHDSFNLFLFFSTFFFLIKSMTNKTKGKLFGFLSQGDVYAILGGLCVAALTMTWVEARFIFTVIALYAIAQMLIDIFRKQINLQVMRSSILLLVIGYVVSLPVISVRLGGFSPDLTLFLTLGVLIFGLVYLLLDRFNMPWLLSLPSIFVIGAIVAVFLYFLPELTNSFPFVAPLGRIADVLYGSGIYGGKVHQTIAEAGTYSISRTVMSYGPTLYWLSWGGFVLLIWEYFRQKGRRDYLFIIVLFIVNIWLASTAGRFLNDHVPLIAILAAWIIWYVVIKIDYKQMIKNIRNAGGGLKGIRRGTKIYHILGVLFIAFLVIMPNALLAFDAAIPSAVTQNGTSNLKIDYFGEEHQGAFGSSSYKEQYWVDAFSWLSDQEAEIVNPVDRPAIISWWDYGFYEVAVGDHPTVADNFQDGIPPAANFHTARSEKEAVAIFIIRLLEGHSKENDGKFSNNIVLVLNKYIGENNTEDIEKWIKDPKTSPSFNQPIGREYDEDLSSTLLVGEQYPPNAFYQDISQLLNSTLTEEELTWLYHDIQETTGCTIRYYGVEGYDTQIFNIFAYLGDRSLVLHALRTGGGERLYNAEDDFVVVKYVGYTANSDGTAGPEGEWTTQELNEMDDSQRRRIVITDTTTENKPDYFKTMFYRTYVGDIPTEFENQISQLPCWGMRHFTAEFVSEFPYFNTRRGAVVIAKYYEGAKINGTVTINGAPYVCDLVVQKNISYFGTSFGIDHDRITTDENGTFSLLAPGGNITIQLRRNTELGTNAFVMKILTFNSEDDPFYYPISDDEAMRKTNYIRDLGNITIDPATISGYVYENQDNDSLTYNQSTDLPLSDVDVMIMEIAQFDEQGQPVSIGTFKELTTDSDGYYYTDKLIPGIYVVRASIDDFIIHEDFLFAPSGNNSYDIVNPEPADINGIAYIDSNANNEYDPDEEADNVNIKLIYTTLTDDRIPVDQLQTETTGAYAFTDLIPGSYIINATITNITTGYFDYITEAPVTLEENKATSLNISLDVAPIKITGDTRYNGDSIGSIRMTFSPDQSIQNNTAQEVSGTSSVEGEYTIIVQPGHYNITVDHTVGEGIFSFSGKLSMKMGEGQKTYNIDMIKESITVQGITLYNGIPKENITIRFDPDNTVQNNSAIYGTERSDETGNYKAELNPGFYTIIIDETITEIGQNITYTFQGELEVTEATPSITYDIIMTREQ
jgi:dolichyl-diphosphooligosaccharide--protein glycosyltransferase